ncbi:MAG: MBL fold metallo-hydrolase [Firmicutes bacterium]|nr:MBL fold metallo-hydrolase [Bacillota bacterium]
MWKEQKWFTVEMIDSNTYAISEYKHWEKVHSYLLIGERYACLIDTGLGIGNIGDVVKSLTNKPVRVITTHFHWDHVGGHKFFNNIYIHQNDSNWMENGLPIPVKDIKQKLMKGLLQDQIPNDFNISNYTIYKGKPTIKLKDDDYIDLGKRVLRIIHTPGHSPGHICIYEEEKGYLFTGDLIYSGTLYAFYPSTNPIHFYDSIVKINSLQKISRLLPGHYNLDIPVKLLEKVKLAFEDIEKRKKLFQGSGTHIYESFKIKL